MTSVLQRIAEGDTSAIDACLAAHGDMVWRLARRYLNRADGDVEDAVQEVFVEVWLSAGRFDPTRGSEATFIATIAHRRLTDYQRRLTTRRRAVRGLERQTLPESETLLGRLTKDEQSGRAVRALRELPEAERDAMCLWLYGGLTHREIGEATDAPVGTVKTRLRRGLMRIGEVIGVARGGDAGVDGRAHADGQPVAGRSEVGDAGRGGAGSGGAKGGAL